MSIQNASSHRSFDGPYDACSADSVCPSVPSTLGAHITHQYKDSINISILEGRFSVGKDLYDQVTDCFCLMFPYLQTGVDYKPEDLIGHHAWGGLSDLDKNLIVLVLKDMAADVIYGLSDRSCEGSSVFRMKWSALDS